MKIPPYLNKNHPLYGLFGREIQTKRQIPPRPYKKRKWNHTKPPIIFFEPHSDDIALSISGVLYNFYKLGHKIYVINFFSHSPPEKSPWNTLFKFSEGDYKKIRKIEDISAFRIFLDCKLKFLDLKSSKYRGYSKFYDKPRIDDPARQSIEEEIAKIKRKFPNSRIFIPAGIGNHVDHVLLRDIAIKHFDNLFFYEDYPYCSHKKYALQTTKKLKAIKAKSITEKININIKSEIVNLYNSQLEKTWKDTHSELKDYFGSIKKDKGNFYERYWTINNPL